jgi:proteasome accessory factor B
VSRIERLLNLTAALLNAERLLSAEQLRERVPGYPNDKASFRRQFERDKDALRELGLPLTMEPLSHDSGGSQFGYRIIPDDYYLRDPGLAPDELSALHLAARVVRVEGLSGDDAQWKLGVPSKAGIPSQLPDDLDGTEAFVPANEALATIFSAIASGRTVIFGYRGESRTVEPGQLSFRSGHWYLAGFDTVRNDDRSFRVDRMDTDVHPGEAVRAGRSASDTHSIASLRRPWELGAGEPTAARVRIDPTQASWALAHLGEAAVDEREADGSIIFRFAVRNADAFNSFVFGLLDRGEVLSPPEYREAIKLWLRKLVDS